MKFLKQFKCLKSSETVLSCHQTDFGFLKYVNSRVGVPPNWMFLGSANFEI